MKPRQNVAFNQEVICWFAWLFRKQSSSTIEEMVMVQNKSHHASMSAKLDAEVDKHISYEALYAVASDQASIVFEQ